MLFDLHVHSNKSDGSFSPAELVSYALEKGLSAFALTDHDTMTVWRRPNAMRTCSGGIGQGMPPARRAKMPLLGQND